MCDRVHDGLSDAELGERLATRVLELIDIPSESRDEAALASHVAEVLRAGGVVVEELDDCGVLAGPARARVVLAGHLDTVPSQANRPGSREADRVLGLGASDMKSALAVMLELALTAAPYRLLFFPREELPVADSALTPLLESHRLDQELVLMMEPTDNAIHAGCLGNVNAEWTFRGRSGHSARPWLADNAIERAAAGISALAVHPPEPHEFAGLVFREVACVTRIAGGIAGNVIPDQVTCHLNYRYAPGRSPQGAEVRLAELCKGHGELAVTSNAPSGTVPSENGLLESFKAIGNLPVAPKQAWTPVAEFALAGYDAVNFGPGAPDQAHRRDESVEIAALVRCTRVLERFAREL